MEKTYDPKTIESTWSVRWEQAGYFAANHTASHHAYCIMLPPPNVTGSLHMGHGFQHTLMDALTRYHRMLGDSTLWQPGTDHSGIAAQMLVERQLSAEKMSRRDLGREAFVERVWRWKAESGDMITKQMRRMGSSVDWSRERFTLDSGLSHAVQTAFIQLYEEGLIYRGKRLVNWDPTLRTAVSDLEVNSEEEQGHLFHIRYPLAEGDGSLTVATTRPETLFGDVAVAVHPDDRRYQHLIGQLLTLPLTDRLIPIIADTYVDPEFGTGCVKITPAHDFNDYQVGLRHHLEPINILTITAHLNESVPEPYRGLDRFTARQKIIEDLGTAHLLEAVVKHTLKVPRGERSGDVIEPYLTDQWYVKTADLAKPAIEAVEKGDITFVPDTWKKTYFQWMLNIEDWCISRQLWWGHRIPAWYDAEGRIYIGRDETSIRQHYALSDNVVLTQDEDVLDTWFSSALWPFSTLGWPEKTPALDQFYPTNVLVTGFDIIFFWVARMIMFGLKFTGQVPFKEVYITGLIRDAEGQKMSKSKGNVLDPIDLIDGISLDDLIHQRTRHLMQGSHSKKIESDTRKYFPNGIPAFGTDALRFTFCALATTGRDIRFDLGRIEGYRNFCNKLWNAARYIDMNTEGYDTGLDQHEAIELSLADRFILSRLQNTIDTAHQHFTHYRFDLLAQKLYEFTWNEYCDWYLELCKPILLSDSATPAAQRGTRRTLLRVFETILRLLHPIIPYITEEIWQKIAPLAGVMGATIMLQPYPQVDATLINLDVEKELEWVQQFILAIRNIRGEMNISPKKPLTVLLQHGTLQDKTWQTNHKTYLNSLAKLSEIQWLSDHETPPPAATALIGDLKIFIPLADLIDKTAEIMRLKKEIEKLDVELLRSEKKLANVAYIEKAPVDVVTKERERVQEWRMARDRLALQLKTIQEIH